MKLIISKLPKKKMTNYINNNNNNIARYILLSIFNKKLLPKFKGKKIINIGVIGGSKFEPELNLINNKKITTFGIEDNDIIVNLNKTITSKISYNLKKHYNNFDLIIFSQVLEHIWNHKNAFNICNRLLKRGGSLYITCPCSSFYHGSPDWHSPGLDHTYLDSYAKEFSLKKIYSCSFGSKRLYKFYHLMQVWPSFYEYFNPVKYFIIKHKNYLKSKMHIRVILSFSDKEFYEDKKYNTETVGIYKK
jgi:SAM-dependent methyltransferase